MSVARPPYINDVMIAAANLEDAEFERDRLVIACGEAIRDALRAGLTHAQIAYAANMSEVEVRRLAEAPATAPDVLGGLPSVLTHEAALISLDPSRADGPRRSTEQAFIDLSRPVGEDPNAAF